MATGKFSFSDSLKPLRSTTAVLAIARWAVDDRVPQRERYLYLAGAISQMVPDPPFVLNHTFFSMRSELVDQSPEVASAMAAFGTWLTDRRPRLEQEAAAERRRWNAIAAEIGRTVR
jgi:hypothetical protein